MIVIIGAGISGLYLGYLLTKFKKKFVIIEKDDRCGGRVYVDDFCGKDVILGAGIGRFEKDKTLFHLCKELGATVNKFPKKINYSFDVTNSLLYYVNRFKKIYVSRDKRSKLTFLDFLKENCKDSNEFLRLSGYTDYIHADVIDTIYDYGFDDNTDEIKSCNFSIDWDELLDSLYKVLKKNIKLKERVLHIDTENCIVMTSRDSYHYSKVVCSTPVNITRDLFPSISIVKDLNCQPFSRIYAKISDGKELLNDRIKTFTIVDSFLQKIIPIDKENGIYMIGYNDNQYAQQSFQYFTTLDQNEIHELLEKEIKKIVNISVKVEFAKIAFWEYGTTYYLPLSKKYRDRDEWLSYAQNPLENVFFIGEGFSHNQGWVQGSLESVDAIKTHLI